MEKENTLNNVRIWLVTSSKINRLTVCLFQLFERKQLFDYLKIDGDVLWENASINIELFSMQADSSGLEY